MRDFDQDWENRFVDDCRSKERDKLGIAFEGFDPNLFMAHLEAESLGDSNQRCGCEKIIQSERDLNARKN